MKSFSGQMVGPNDHAKWASLVKDGNGDEWALIAQPQAIETEWRVLVANGEAITSCQYRRNGKFEMYKQIPEAVMGFANQVARQPWQPDPIYMLDIGLIDGGLKVIEANSFSCSDFYVMDYGKVIDAANKAAVAEWNKVNYD